MGGALELPKCSFHAVHWGFASRGSSFPDPKETEKTITIKQDEGDQNNTTIQQMKPTTAHKTLGHWKEPAGYQTEQYDRLKQKCEKLANTAFTSPMNRKDAWVYYFAIFLPSITFPLSNSFFDRQTLWKTTHPATKKIAAKCEFARTMATEILYGPASLGGASFRECYIEQGIGQPQLFLRHWRNPDTQAGKLARIAVYWIQLHCGTGTSFLKDVETEIPHTPSKWYSSLREFLAHSHLRLRLDEDGVLPTQREHDEYIMDKVLASGKFKEKSDIRTINNCRLYLQAVTIADLAKPEGTHPDTDLLQGNPITTTSTTTMITVTQEKPTEKAWELWKRCNRLWSDKESKLHKPLGDWNVSVPEMRRNWWAYWDHTEGTCTIRTDQVNPFRVTTFTVGSNGRLTAPVRETVHDIPIHGIPITVKETTGGWRIKENHVRQIRKRKTDPNEGSFGEILGKGPTAMASLFPTDRASYKNPGNMFKQESLLVATDGGVAINAGLGWVIATPEGKILKEGSAQVGGRSIMSYRAELYGLLAVLWYLHRAEYYVGQPLPQITLYCDNKGAIEKVEKIYQARDHPSWSKGIVHPLIAEYDVLHEIAILFEAWNTPLSFRHIAAHQDSCTPFHELSTPAKLNIRADQLATRAVQMDKPVGMIPMLPNAGALVESPRGTITRKLPQMIRHDTGARALMSSMKEKYGWTDQVADDIDWDTHQALIRRHSKRSVQVVKLVHDIVPTNARRKKYGQVQHSDCPLCRLHPETTHHIMRCQHGTRKKWRESTKGEMVKAGKNARASMEMVEAFVGSWFHWIATGQPPDSTGLPIDIREAIENQTHIGWNQVIHGRVSKKWAALRPPSTPTSVVTPKENTETTKWTLDVLDALWKQWFNVWEARNKTVHGNTQTERQQKQRIETEQQIKDIYARKSDYLPSEQALLQDTAEEFIATKGLIALKNWVRLWAPVFAQSAQRCHTLSLRGVPSIRTFFKPPAPV